MKTLLEMMEEAALLVDQLNNLDFSNKEDDLLFLDNLSRLEEIENNLSGKRSVIQHKTKVYLQ